MSSGGRVHSGWRPDLCCPLSVVLLVLYVQVRDEEERNAESRQEGVTERLNLPLPWLK